MNAADSTSLRYPTGKFVTPTCFSESAVQEATEKIAALPQQLNAVVKTLDSEALQSCYREGSWTAAQVIHHLADSHLNSFLRFKQCYYKNGIHIIPYNEQAWALHHDAQNLDVTSSIQLLTGLHARWAAFLEGFQTDDWKKSFYHTGYDKHYTLWTAVALYAWHGTHHIGHLQLCKA